MFLSVSPYLPWFTVLTNAIMLEINPRMNSLIKSETSRPDHFPKACQLLKKKKQQNKTEYTKPYRQFTFKCNSRHWHLLVENLLVLKMVSAPPTSTTVSANSKQGNKKKTGVHKTGKSMNSTFRLRGLRAWQSVRFVSDFPPLVLAVFLWPVVTDTHVPKTFRVISVYSGSQDHLSVQLASSFP